jgi:glucosamine 6-phosphate synthetase-like amidotransferase/phosphosugar isomerase protein
VVEQKIMGTYRFAVVQTKDAKSIFFVKNSGDFVIGTNADKSEVVVSTDLNVLSAKNKGIDGKFHHTHIPNNELCELNTETCEFTFTKLEKKINIESQRKPKVSFNHIVHEEIYESIDAVDQATDFGGKFISDNQVVLGGFQKSSQELSQVQDLIIQGIGSSNSAAQYGAHVFK